MMKTRKGTFLLVLIGLLIPGMMAHAQTVVSETTIQDNRTWPLSGSPYYIQGNVIIEEKASLIIESGCEIIFEGKYGFEVAGQFTLSGWAQNITLRGKDLGDGKHILWKGIRATTTKAMVSLVHAEIQDAEVVVDFSDFTYQGTGPEMYCSRMTFTNNLTVMKTGTQGSVFYIGESKFINNETAIVGNYTRIDTGNIYRPLRIISSTFEENVTAIQSANCIIESCKFTGNTTAIEDALYCRIDSSGFERNKLAIRGYGLQVERCIFFLNDKAIIQSGRNPQRDQILLNSIIRSNHFESNKEAVYMEGEAMLADMSCNLFFKNDFALALPDSLNNYLNEAYRVEKNIFIQNNVAIQVNPLNGNNLPAPGAGLQPVSFLYNALAFNFILIDHTSPNNLNFFHNYILANKFIIELGIDDGTDKQGIGLINYTVSGDTSSVDDLITVNKIEDVIKHQNFEDSLYAGNTYAFEMCHSAPGYVLGIDPELDVTDILVYPNPFVNLIRVEWAEETSFDIELYNLSGQKLSLGNMDTHALNSPVLLDLSHLESGMYFLRLKSDFGFQSLKLIKE